MIIKYKMAHLRVSKCQEEKILNYLNAKVDDLYYVEGLTNMCFDINKSFLIEEKINYCRNKAGYAIVSYKNGFLVTREFLNVFNIFEKLKRGSKQ